MPKSNRTSTSGKIGRRVFLFVLGFAGSTLLAEWLSFWQNRQRLYALLNQGIVRLEPHIGLKLPQIPVPTATSTVSPVIPSPTPTPVASSSPVATPTPVASPVRKPVEVQLKTLAGVQFYQTTIDLNDPENLLTIGLANNASQANSAVATNGDEAFAPIVQRHQAAVVANGTFFSKDAQKRVMGNLVAGGKILKYSRWENHGTTLGITANRELEMITAKVDGKPEWNQHWFSLTCGPRLLKQGKVWLAPKSEGFTDPHVLDRGYRTAIGFPASRKQLYLVSFLASLSLQQEAEMMQGLGCVEAMNLDGGASMGLAYRGDVLIAPGRNLTNVIVVYDVHSPAPSALKQAWMAFEQGVRPEYPS
ncbi:MAG: phosphodiester glycosidase family protein [Desertifilum sp. SIO1I2]|nr:phosphodiester glycosidase family protein [Desertifilum sp. SIO1I2]